MPIHNWTRVDAGIFHDFHHSWIEEIKRILNRDLLGPDYYALSEQITGPFGPDVLTLKHPDSGGRSEPTGRGGGGTTVAETIPKVTFHIKDSPQWYAQKKRSVTVRHRSGDEMVAVIEIVSSGNKKNDAAFDTFVRKSRELLYAGIHLLLVDVYPPTSRDPEGIHPKVWGTDDDNTFHFDPDRPLTFASYIGGEGAQAFVEPAAVGEPAPSMPVFLAHSLFVTLPLDFTYTAAFDAVPARWRKVLTEKPKPKPRRKRK
jgi:hypothetical protein